MAGSDRIAAGYEVGYCRPPKATQFRKGCSGNPKGRPKGTRNLKSDLAEELAERITLSEGGKPIRLSKQRALVKSLTARAIKGDGRAVTALLNLMLRVLDLEAPDDEDETLSPSDAAILEAYADRLLRKPSAKPKTTLTKRNNNNKEESHAQRAKGPATD